ncbi:MAG TPA: ABC transporter substrate-binding protein, partial [Gemmatimonadales bacterium]|nr:ABC transporter substrate-binding protein [Gemmatimonadales bacterium]
MSAPPASPRVVSLIASATEIVCALGCEHLLAARSHECDWPPSVRRLPAASRPSFAVDVSSQLIDLSVKERLAKALSIYEVDAEVLRSVRPDVIITQTQCEVCAVTPSDVERAVCQLAERDIRVVALEPNRLGDVWTDILTVAQALGVPERGHDLVTRLRERVDRIAASVPADRPTVATIEWIEPLMAAGNWMPELIDLAGGRSLFGEAGRHSPWLTWDDLVARDPDVILVSPCGFGIGRTVAEMGLLTRRGEWPSL